MILCSRPQYHGMYAAMLSSFTSTLVRYASLLTAHTVHVVPCRTLCWMRFGGCSDATSWRT
jgi:hypothetical protein